MSRYRIGFALLTSLVLLTLVAACGSGQSSEAKNKPPQQDQVAVNEVKSTFINLSNAKSFRALLSAQTLRPDGTQGLSEFLYEFVLPDKYQLAVPGSATATRVVGSETFSKAANGTWSLIPEYSGSDYAGYNKLFDQKTVAALMEEVGKTATVTKGAMDSIEGKQCQVYTVTDTPTQKTTDICIADRLPVRIIYNFGQLKTTVVFRDFGASIDLSRPPI